MTDRDGQTDRRILFKQVTIEMYLLNTLINLNFLRENHKYYLGYPWLSTLILKILRKPELRAKICDLQLLRGQFLVFSFLLLDELRDWK